MKEKDQQNRAKRNHKRGDIPNTGHVYYLVNWIDGLCAKNCSGGIKVSMDLFRPAQLTHYRAQKMLYKVLGQGWEITDPIKYIKEMKERDFLGLNKEELMEKEYIIGTGDLKRFVSDDSLGEYSVTTDINEASRFNHNEALKILWNVVGPTRARKRKWQVFEIDTTENGVIDQDLTSADGFNGETFADLDKYINNMFDADKVDEICIEDEERMKEVSESFNTPENSEFDTVDEDFLNGFNNEDADFSYEALSGGMDREMFFNSSINYRDYQTFKNLSVFFLEDFLRNMYVNLNRFKVELAEEIDKYSKRVSNIQNRLSFKDEEDDEQRKCYEGMRDAYEEIVSKCRAKIRMIDTLINSDSEEYITGTVKDTLEYLGETGFDPKEESCIF